MMNYIMNNNEILIICIRLNNNFLDCRLEKLLNKTDIDYINQYKKSIDRKHHYYSIFLPKYLATKLLNISFKNIVIKENINGKPYFDNISNFFYNCSHSGNIFVLALSTSEIGTDLEMIRTYSNLVVRRFLSKEEEKILIRFYLTSNVKFYDI